MSVRSAWLIENGKLESERRYYSIKNGDIYWTKNRNEALQFSRQIDAERFIENIPHHISSAVAAHTFEDNTGNCVGCIHAKWFKSENKISDLTGEGKCTYTVEIPELPPSKEWFETPTVIGGVIHKRIDLPKKCVYFTIKQP